MVNTAFINGVSFSKSQAILTLYLPKIGVSTSLSDRTPGGVNSLWPTSVSKKHKDFSLQLYKKPSNIYQIKILVSTGVLAVKSLI